MRLEGVYTLVYLGKSRILKIIFQVNFTINMDENKIAAKVAETLKDLPEDVPGLRASITGHKGHFTREIKTVNSTCDAIAGEALKTPAMQERLLNQKETITIRHKILEGAYTVLLKLVDDAQRPAIVAEEQVEQDRFEVAEQKIFLLCERIQAEIEDRSNKQTQNHFQNQINPISRAARDLKPKILDTKFTPNELEEWKTNFGEYFAGSGLLQEQVPDQVSVAKRLISTQLWTDIEGKLNPRVPVVRFDANRKIISNKQTDAENLSTWTFLDFVDSEFRRHY